MIFFLGRWLLFFLLLALIFRWVFGKGQNKNKARERKSVQEMKKDPVCGVYIPEKQAVSLKWKGQEFYFCSSECRDRFRRLG